MPTPVFVGDDPLARSAHAEDDDDDTATDSLLPLPPKRSRFRRASPTPQRDGSASPLHRQAMAYGGASALLQSISNLSTDAMDAVEESLGDAGDEEESDEADEATVRDTLAKWAQEEKARRANLRHKKPLVSPARALRSRPNLNDVNRNTSHTLLEPSATSVALQSLSASVPSFSLTAASPDSVNPPPQAYTSIASSGQNGTSPLSRSVPLPSGQEANPFVDPPPPAPPHDPLHDDSSSLVDILPESERSGPGRQQRKAKTDDEPKQGQGKDDGQNSLTKPCPTPSQPLVIPGRAPSRRKPGREAPSQSFDPFRDPLPESKEASRDQSSYQPGTYTRFEDPYTSLAPSPPRPMTALAVAGSEDWSAAGQHARSDSSSPLSQGHSFARPRYKNDDRSARQVWWTDWLCCTSSGDDDAQQAGRTNPLE